VPAWLRGCWRRAWIEFADGSRDETEQVWWLQTDAAMADVRIAAARPSFTGVSDLRDCSPDQLAALATANASTGVTRVVATVDHHDGTHSCTATWHTYGVGINFQPVCGYPEPGLLHLDAGATVMIERAPSGAYVEEWHLVPGSREAPQRHLVRPDGSELFVAGTIAIEARDRRPATLPAVPLAELLRRAPGPHAPDVAALLDCEFSVATRADDGTFRITASTLPWRDGTVLDVAA
jgi:hypothetical protein